MRIAKEEIFGPVLSVLTFEDEDDAIRIANDVMYGLAATVWTTDLGRAFRVADKIDAGIIWTNCPHYLPVNVPYEGHKMSGPRRGPRRRGAPDVHPPQDALHQLQRRRRWHGPEPRDHRATWRPIRAQFHPAPGITYLDSATYGLPPQATVDALDQATRGRGRRAPATGSTDWDEPTDQAPRDFARLIGAPEDTIATIPAASVGTGLVAGMLGPGDEVVVPADEFTSSLFPILVAKERGATVREVAVRGPGRVDRAGHDARGVQPRPDADRQDGRPRGDHGGGRPPRRAGHDRRARRPSRSCRSRASSTGSTTWSCSGYKHLLSPRGTAYLYVRRDHWDELEPRNANWRAADLPYGRYFGGPLTLAPDARRFDVSRGWFPGSARPNRCASSPSGRSTGAFEAVRDLAKGLADRLGVPWYGGSLVCAQLDDGEAARAACLAAGVKASVRGTAVRFSVHVYNTEADLDRAAEAIAPFTGG